VPTYSPDVVQSSSAFPAYSPTSPPPTAAAVQPNQGSAHTAGFVFLLAIFAAALGGYKAGPKGAATGFLIAGSGMNAVRAARLRTSPDPARREEALWSGIGAAVGAGIAGWLVLKG
jgi:hypothetical protein